jgi:hypothetical protein
MLLFNKVGDDKDDLYDDPPMLRFLPSKKEIIQRLLIRAANMKNANEFNIIYKLT